MCVSKTVKFQRFPGFASLLQNVGVFNFFYCIFLSVVCAITIAALRKITSAFLAKIRSSSWRWRAADAAVPIVRVSNHTGTVRLKHSSVCVLSIDGLCYSAALNCMRARSHCSLSASFFNQMRRIASGWCYFDKELHVNKGIWWAFWRALQGKRGLWWINHS